MASAVGHIGRMRVSVAYRYWNNLWSHSRNAEMYGRFASESGLGGNLGVDITGEGDLLPLQQKAKALLDHRCLFTDVPDFVYRPSTLEAMTVFIFDRLSEDGEGLKSVMLTENGQWRCRKVRGDDQLELSLSYRNLELTVRGPLDPESALVARREDLISAVDGVFSRQPIMRENEITWARELFSELKKRIEILHYLMIDLGRHKIRVDEYEASFG